VGGQRAVLELTGLRRQYGDVLALDGLSFTVPPGQVFGFLGPNGAGKTTAMRAIVGVTAVDAGEVRWNGEAIGQEARSRIGYMPEERGLYPAMRVLEQLEYLARLHGLTAAQARAGALQWSERLGLADQGQAKVEALSLGNQQRVQLAAALVHEPQLLVLDEPFSGLDPAGVDVMSEVLAERAAAGVTMLFSSHQLDLVEHLCQSVAIIHRGRLVAQGSVEDLGRAGKLRVAVRVAGTTRAAGPGIWAASRKLTRSPLAKSCSCCTTAPTRRPCSTGRGLPDRWSSSASCAEGCPRCSATQSDPCQRTGAPAAPLHCQEDLHDRQLVAADLAGGHPRDPGTGASAVVLDRLGDPGDRGGRGSRHSRARPRRA
jgi:ABC-2 type transport system ATP-binding protein